MAEDIIAPSNGDGNTGRSTSRLQGLLSLRPALKQKILDWLVSFYHLDPRYQILTYFNEVAREGGDNLLDEGDEYDSEDIMVRRRRSFTKIEKLLKDVFKTTSILTVWRPTTNDAMRLMMEGKGVGKGLDIKGKSARGGKLSGYVPFLQIHEEADKEKVAYINRKAKLRVYFDSRDAREQVMDELEPLGNDYMCFDKDIVIHSEMIEIDNFASCGKYGIELSQRLFWEGYVKHRDISRPPDLQTGRASLPGFQDANLHALKSGCEHPGTEHVPVVYQFCKEDPMDSLHLIMAYEENGIVTPVVSDFDGFLLGWKREALWFGCQLPREQEDLMLWCVDQIEEILDSPTTADSWTVRWLEILKKESTPHPEIPHYGFGDPKSYGIMERAALQLSKSGAVRHGSECFNYYFPQEIDDTFLVVSDTFKGVPWRYVNVRQLQSVLTQLIKDGFVFPIHPKWILCDPGWKDLYDSLMASDALYAEYTKDVWYPRFSGIREKIERVHKKHPLGFQRLRTDKPVSDEDEKYSPLRQSLERREKLSGNALSELAEIEYEAYSAKIAKQKRRASTKNTNEGTADEDDDSDEDSLDGEAYQTSVSVQG